MTATRAVLFDLDGTLIDTGRDLLAALNALRAERGLPALDFEAVKYLVGHGSRRLMQEHLMEEGDELEPLRERFLVEYDRAGHAQSKLFDGMQEVLDHLAAAGLPWAIVTNKPTKQTEDLLGKLDLRPAPSHVVCSDTLPRHKPYPDGLLHVCKELGVEPAACFYVGDNDLDVRASGACGMPFLAAGWGYWEPDKPAERLLARPQEIIAALAS
ncbi:MAG: HAD-IA family hydrolase [Betaproteobacteria bacterium AqS2]|uniref:HAD-IA family hydrolase n=1 Tax=Candidatus Amphirhobacter heronislandensis TaxID=1732024 RepID=A0A930UGG4_9GAMM|nr:HAD-IA family hydrolase [Betaproteobacteria bacterium AqS2]